MIFHESLMTLDAPMQIQILPGLTLAALKSKCLPAQTRSLFQDSLSASDNPLFARFMDDRQDLFLILQEFNTQVKILRTGPWLLNDQLMADAAW